MGQNRFCSIPLNKNKKIKDHSDKLSNVLSSAESEAPMTRHMQPKWWRIPEGKKKISACDGGCGLIFVRITNNKKKMVERRCRC